MKDLNINFKSSIRDLIYLLDKDYPKKASIEIVGNRYRLNSDERMVLYRGVYSSRENKERKQKRVDPLKRISGNIIVDGYNVFITLESYLTGRTVFRSLDGYVRDVAGVFGNYTFGELTMRCTEIFFNFIREYVNRHHNEPLLIIIYLDYPVSKSGEFASYLREKLTERNIRGTAEVVGDTDARIIKEHAGDIIATSDTVIIDKAARCIDIPDYIISYIFQKDILDLQEL